VEKSDNSLISRGIKLQGKRKEVLKKAEKKGERLETFLSEKKRRKEGNTFREKGGRKSSR